MNQALATLPSVRVRYLIPWRAILTGFLVVMMFIPARRYTFSSALPFQAEPYRVVVGLVLLCWLGSALIDPRVRVRRTPFDAPIFVFVAVAIASLLVNADHASSVMGFVVKQLGFYAGVLLLYYFVASVAAGKPDFVLHTTKVLVYSGAVLAVSAIVERRTGDNLFGHLDSVIPVLERANVYVVSAATDSRGATNRAYASSQHPIEFSAVLVMLTPLALVLAALTRQRRWWIALVLFAPAMTAALSRTLVPMLAAGIVAGLVVRRKEVIRLWPALIPLIAIIHFAVPGAMGSLAKSFFPQGGLIADQKTGPVGSGRISTLGPALRTEFDPNPVLGVGLSTRVTTEQDPSIPANAPILDNQWLGILLETGFIGFVVTLWLFLRVLKLCGGEARRDYTERGWLLAGLCSSVAAFAAAMFTFDAFSFVQVTLVFTTLVGLTAALLMSPDDTPENAGPPDAARRPIAWSGS